MSYKDQDLSDSDKFMQLIALSATLQELQENQKRLKASYEIYKIFADKGWLLPEYNDAGMAYGTVNEQIFQVENEIDRLKKRETREEEKIQVKNKKIKIYNLLS